MTTIRRIAAASTFALVAFTATHAAGSAAAGPEHTGGSIQAVNGWEGPFNPGGVAPQGGNGGPDTPDVNGWE